MKCIWDRVHLCIVFVQHLLKTKKALEETGGSRYVYQNKLNKGCFQLDMISRDFKDIPRKTAFDKV